MADDYTAQLLAVEAKLVKEPDNDELLALKADLLELIELSGSLEEDEQKLDSGKGNNKNNHTTATSYQPSTSLRQTTAGESDTSQKTTSRAPHDSNNLVQHGEQQDKGNVDNNTTGIQRRVLTEAETLAKRKEKNRKKREKMREKVKEQLDAAESVKQSWQSFANQRGLKGLTKRSIFASPCSVTGKVGVGTNGIADAPSASGASSASLSSAPITSKRKY